MTTMVSAPDFLSVTELAGDDVSKEQIERLCNRYYWAAQYCKQKDVVEVACGTGQGLGYLASIAKSVVAGDYSLEILKIAKAHYGNRAVIEQLDALNLPYADKSKDVIILFEALYYLASAETFVRECRRVLRENGTVLIATANKDLYDFNPSPFSHLYYGVCELNKLFTSNGFSVECFGGTPVDKISWRQKILRPIKKMAIRFHLIPESMEFKKLLKRFVFGKLCSMPAEVLADTCPYFPPKPLSLAEPDRGHKVIFCAARLSG